jgi:hypothetical protein
MKKKTQKFTIDIPYGKLEQWKSKLKNSEDDLDEYSYALADVLIEWLDYLFDKNFRKKQE